MKKGYIIGIIIASVIVILIASVFIWYGVSIQAPKITIEEPILVDIEKGESTSKILQTLKEKRVIKSDLAAKVYIKLKKVNGLQAGKYQFEEPAKLEQVIHKIENGEVRDETIKITFKEGKNIRYIVSQIAENTDNTANEIYSILNDTNYIRDLINKYWFLTKDILSDGIYYPLEGYLYPETYTFENKKVSPKVIFEKMLNQMDKVLTQRKEAIQNSGRSVHEILTMASITELEGNDAKSREGIASVIYNRLEKRMSIGSDVTTYYAIKVDVGQRDLYAKEINTYNAYNTRGPNMEGRLPVGPIDNASTESIDAVLKPSQNSYLYFVSDVNGDIYFSSTYEEHQSTISKLQKKGLWYEYKK